MAILMKYRTGEIADVLRWSQTVIDLADGDPPRANFIVGSPLAVALVGAALLDSGWAVTAGARTSTTPLRWPEAATR